jgi:outer membrane protein OmpA-like peptidoglycan-associated protein
MSEARVLNFSYRQLSLSMKIFLLLFILLVTVSCAQKYLGPSNVGREYGNPKMPLVVSHLAGANKKMLDRFPRNSHFILAKILCFHKSCRIQSGHTAPLQSISFKKFKKKVARNAKKGAYKNIKVDTTHKHKPVVSHTIPITADTANIQPPVFDPIVQADTLIVLGAEVLFEINKSTLRSEHFETLNPIVEYLLLHPERSVNISGHTDNTGSEAHNLRLSKQRADVVAEYLVSNGVDINSIETSGLGSAKPIAENTTEEGRKKNRRVELLIHD